jgi:hypothetical protein
MFKVQSSKFRVERKECSRFKVQKKGEVFNVEHRTLNIERSFKSSKFRKKGRFLTLNTEH